MGRASLRGIMGSIKDKASLGKAAIMSQPEALLSLLRATTHDSHSPPSPKHIAALLSLSGASRAAASAAIQALMERLTRTRDAYVALKCLMAAHHVAMSGGFILRDQLSVLPAMGGRNYLNLSKFRDASTALSWELSSWVRWYAHYVETLVSVSRELGFFLGERTSDPSYVSALSNGEVLRETDALVGLVVHVSKQPEMMGAEGNKLVEEIRSLVGRDWLWGRKEMCIRVGELGERVSCLSFGESVELVCALKRVQECRHRSSFFSKNPDFAFWDLVDDITRTLPNQTPTPPPPPPPPSLTLIAAFRTHSARFPLSPAHPLNFASARLSHLPSLHS